MPTCCAKTAATACCTASGRARSACCSGAIPSPPPAYSRAFSFCGSAGVEIMEPLSFKGRRGSGIAGGRCAYADASLAPRWDWEKYRTTYRVWGRLLYNPDATRTSGALPAQRFERRARPSTALANASRILPIVTTAHMPSAAQQYLLARDVHEPADRSTRATANPYTDTPAPKVFGNVSPLDPQLFSRINDFADELLKGERSGKYSPIEVAQWMEDLAAAAGKNLHRRHGQGRQDSPSSAGWRSMSTFRSGSGRFFAAKFRAACCTRIHERTGDRAALEEA